MFQPDFYLPEANLYIEYERIYEFIELIQEKVVMCINCQKQIEIVRIAAIKYR
jgi:hypothetical protein